MRSTASNTLPFHLVGEELPKPFCPIQTRTRSFLTRPRGARCLCMVSRSDRLAQATASRADPAFAPCDGCANRWRSRRWGKELVAEGRQLDLTNGCYACHGLEAQGRPWPQPCLDHHVR